MLQVIGVRVWVAPTTARAARSSGDAEDDADGVVADERQQSSPLVAGGNRAPPSRADAAHDSRSRAERIAAMDWSTLRESAATCTACELHKGRTHSVFASAPGQADWLVVGDPPSADDDRDGLPITGDAGRLLDNMLVAVQLSRASTALVPARACVTTIVKCRPPHDRAADASEIAMCAPYLQRQIALVQPKVAFAMGRCAAQGMVTSTEPIGKLRGVVHHAHGVPVVVTFHPGHLVRHSSDKAKTWEDLCRAVAVVDGYDDGATSG